LSNIDKVGKTIKWRKSSTNDTGNIGYLFIKKKMNFNLYNTPYTKSSIGTVDLKNPKP
jgi:hypothetical protein